MMCIAGARAQNKGNMITLKRDAGVEELLFNEGEAGEFKFQQETKDLGNIPEGADAECEFEFKNTGKKAITIFNINAPCGCTVVTWPYNRILPGQKGTIHVACHTTGCSGKISKYLIINSDASLGHFLLNFTADVVINPVASIQG